MDNTNRIGFRFEYERKQEEREWIAAGFCDCLFEALMELPPEDGDKILTDLHEKIYWELPTE